jgi:hypothetical protein
MRYQTKDTDARIATECRMQVADFYYEDGAIVTLHHKGDHWVAIGLQWQAAEAIRAYVAKAGPLHYD